MLATCRSSFALHSLHLSKFSSPSPSSYARQASSIPHKVSSLNLSLYLVADRKSVNTEEEFFLKIRNSIQGGVSCIQLRDQHRDLEASLKTARRLKTMLREAGIPLIVNDRLDVAQAVQAEGFYLENKTLSYREIRALVGKTMFIGLPVHTIEDVFSVNQWDVDYISAKIFPSKRTRPEETRVWGIEGLKKIRSLTHHPIVAIGGINLSNLEAVCEELHLNQDGVAMVGDLWRRDDQYTTAQTIRKVLQDMIIKQKFRLIL